MHAAGASVLRARLTCDDDGVLSVTAADDSGLLVITAESLTLRPVQAGQVEAAASAGLDALFGVGWVPVPVPDGPRRAPRLAVLRDELAEASSYPDIAGLTVAIAAGEPMPEAVLVRAARGTMARTPTRLLSPRRFCRPCSGSWRQTCWPMRGWWC